MLVRQSVGSEILTAILWTGILLRIHKNTIRKQGRQAGLFISCPPSQRQPILYQLQEKQRHIDPLDPAPRA
jgi:hypothetical protein